MRELLTVQLGQCGNQVGCELFDTLLREATASHQNDLLSEVRHSFFRETIHGQQADSTTGVGSLRARAVLIDTEPKVVSAAIETAKKTGRWEYSKSNAFAQQSGAANNWAFGNKHMGPIVWAGASDIIPASEFEACDIPGGVLLLGSLAGGTGSGVGAYVTERLRSEYSKSTLLNVVVWPYSSGEVIVQNYNACLSLAHLMNDTDGVVIVENDHMHEICMKLLNMQHVTFDALNHVISQHLAQVLMPSFKGVCVPLGGVSLSEPTRNFLDPVSHLCCHPAYKLLNIKTIPQIPADSLAFSSNTWPALLKHLRQMLIVNAHMDEAMDWSVQLPNRVPETGPAYRFTKSVANMLFLRGSGLSAAETSAFAAPLLYPSWNFAPLLVAGHSWPLGGSDKSASVLSNSQAVVPSTDRVLEKAMQMFESKAYVHHYTAHGIEEATFQESFTVIEKAIFDYRNL